MSIIKSTVHYFRVETKHSIIIKSAALTHFVWETAVQIDFFSPLGPCSIFIIITQRNQLVSG